VPRFYLARFANERMQMSTVDRRTRARWTAAIKETAAEKDFYTVVNAEGEKDGKTEHLLSHIEGNAARAIRNILSAGFPLFRPSRKIARTLQPRLCGTGSEPIFQAAQRNCRSGAAQTAIRPSRDWLQ
jgi:Protein of unknown function (DUF4238)